MSVCQTHTLRLTRCRLEPALTGRRHSQSFRLLPTEHLIVLLSPQEEEHMTNKFVPLREIKRSDLALPGYIDAIHAKIVDVNPQEIVHSSDGSIFRRVSAQSLAHSHDFVIVYSVVRTNW
ncbi:hypothetical protein GBAR_LOCUS18517 [Geodia barretti]|uniref:Cell division control protein 24 OB domain-containing protein n=1 Tax=Geodia barretti TaxID=519541 RepID=A0AA35X028_GEOBA|nr:hypothetical protein GBAR_LOCUS18517 [Geodia barretti]